MSGKVTVQALFVWRNAWARNINIILFRSWGHHQCSMPKFRHRSVDAIGPFSELVFFSMQSRTMATAQQLHNRRNWETHTNDPTVVADVLKKNNKKTLLKNTNHSKYNQYWQPYYWSCNHTPNHFILFPIPGWIGNRFMDLLCVAQLWELPFRARGKRVKHPFLAHKALSTTSKKNPKPWVLLRSLKFT